MNTVVEAGCVVVHPVLVNSTLGATKLAKVAGHVLQDDPHDEHAEERGQPDLQPASLLDQPAQAEDQLASNEGDKDEHEQGKDGPPNIGNRSQHSSCREEDGDDGEDEGERGRHLAIWREKGICVGILFQGRLRLLVGLLHGACVLLLIAINCSRHSRVHPGIDLIRYLNNGCFYL